MRFLLLLALPLVAIAQEDAKDFIRRGMEFRDGKGVVQDHRRAFDWYTKAAALGDAEGEDNVGYMYFMGWGVARDYQAAFRYFSASAERGHHQGQYNLGRMYWNGLAVPRNFARARELWEQAYRNGSRYAPYHLFRMHLAGHGVPKDPHRAMQWCERAMKRDDLSAYVSMGELQWRRGSTEEAKRLWEFAARAGDAQAVEMLAFMKLRTGKNEPGKFAQVAVDHVQQGWNLCGTATAAMMTRWLGTKWDQFEFKSLCGSPMGEGTDWALMVMAAKKLGHDWELVTYAHDDEGFAKALAAVKRRSDAGEPVIIDVTRTGPDGQANGHTLVFAGYHEAGRQAILVDPAQPWPGIDLVPYETLKADWHSRWWTKTAKQRARPVIFIR